VQKRKQRKADRKAARKAQVADALRNARLEAAGYEMPDEETRRRQLIDNVADFIQT
jgi:hypothetical protein